MEIFDNPINRDIVLGFLPHEKLYPASKPITEFNIDMIAKNGIKYFTSEPDFFNYMFFSCQEKVQEIEDLQLPFVFISDFNTIINANHSSSYLDPYSSLQIAINLIPVVTNLDKILWYGIHIFYLEQSLNQVKYNYDPKELMFTWIHLLLIAQEKEVKTGKTISISTNTFNGSILDLLQADFESSEVAPHLRNLTQIEIENLNTLFKSRHGLASMIQDKINQEKTICKKTNKEWELFLKIINDLSDNENNAISILTKNASPKQKIKAIEKYNKKIDSIKRAKYSLDGTSVNLLEIYEAAKNRLINCCAYAKTANNKPFPLNPSISILAVSPLTYHAVFISFHLFRLEPNLQNANRFFSLALTSVNRNLDDEKEIPESTVQMITDFYTTIVNFTKTKQEILNQLSFEHLQPDAVITNSSFYEAQYETDYFRNKLNEKVNLSMKNGSIYEEHIDKDQILAQVNQYELESNEKAIAQKIIMSINIIYLFCDAARMLLSNNLIENDSSDIINTYRHELIKIEDKLVHKVYAHINDKEMDLLEYREKSGIIYTTISEKEKQMEKLQSEEFSAILKCSIEELLTNLESQDTDGILHIKGRIKEQISSFPDCDEKLNYAEWLDSISNRINDVLIRKCKNTTNSYQSIKEKIISSLGQKCIILPSSTIDSLTTAELLYNQYAKQAFADDGFDFSCISALYYQAFEDAYNDLIWAKYALFLNDLRIGNIMYTSILKDCKNSHITDEEAKGYLFDNDVKQRKYYLITRNNSTSVNSRCMYKSFAIIMEQINESTILHGFCDFFAKLTGFSGEAEMFSDTIFMQKCHEFTEKVQNSANNRNNASHGGTFVSLTRCSDDKKTVLNNLESVRQESVGLLQQLLYILQKD